MQSLAILLTILSLTYNPSRVGAVKARRRTFLGSHSIQEKKCQQEDVQVDNAFWRSKPPRIIIAGAPASGKGTQSELIQKEFQVVHVSSGDLLRDAVAKKTSLGKVAKQYMDRGELVPDQLVIQLIKNRLNENDCKARGWLLDGFPRTSEQASALREAGINADCFVALSVPDDVAIRRIVGRKLDPVTGLTYHDEYNPPTDKEVLNRLVQRSDDTMEKAHVRLSHFHRNMAAVSNYYTDIKLNIDGTGNKYSVYNSIRRELRKKCLVVEGSC